MRDFFNQYLSTIPSLSDRIYGSLAKQSARYNSSISTWEKDTYFGFQGFRFVGFGKKIFDCITNPTNEEIAFLVSKLMTDYRKSFDQSIFNDEVLNSNHIAYSAMAISMMNLKRKLPSITDDDWQKIVNTINSTQTLLSTEQQVDVLQVKTLLEKICSNITFFAPPADPTCIYLDRLSNTSLYHKFRTEKEEAWTNAIQSVLLKPEEYPIKLTMLKHDYALRRSKTCILSSVCDDVVLPFTYIIDFAEELKKVIPQEETEEKTQYLKKIAELAYRSLNRIKIDDKYKENTDLQTLCLKYKTLKEDYKKIQREWQNTRLRRSFSSMFYCASPTANNDEYYQEKLLQLFIEHKLPPTATSEDIIKYIEDFIPEDRFKLHEAIIKNTTLKTTLFSCTPARLSALCQCFNDEEQKKQLVDNFIKEKKPEFYQSLSFEELSTLCQCCNDEDKYEELVTEFIKNQLPESIQSLTLPLHGLIRILNPIAKVGLSEELRKRQQSTTIPAFNPKPLPENNNPAQGIELIF